MTFELPAALLCAALLGPGLASAAPFVNGDFAQGPVGAIFEIIPEFSIPQ